MQVDGTGGVDVVTTQVLRRDRLPGVVTQFHPGDLAIVREEVWSPVADGSATATVTGTIPGAPVSLTGTAVLEPTDDGARGCSSPPASRCGSRSWAARSRTSSAANSSSYLSESSDSPRRGSKRTRNWAGNVVLWRAGWITRIDYGAPAEKIYQDFTSRAYWETLMDAYRFLTPQSEITRFTSDGSGTDVVFKQNLPRAYLPPIARSVVPVDMIVTREQHFDPYDHANKQGKGTYRASIPHGPGHFGGKYVPHRDRIGQRATSGQRLQGVHPADRRCAGGPDPSPHQATLRCRGGVHR